MTTSDERIAAAIDAYLELRSQGESMPTFDDLSEEERREVEETIEILRIGEGIEPSLSPPSLEYLLADSEFAEVFQHAPEASVPEQLAGRLTHELNEVDVTSFDPPSSDMLHGHVATLVRSRGHRVCVLVLTNFNSPDELPVELALGIAGERLGRSPDLAAILVAVNDESFSCAAVDAQDTVMCIDAPTGQTEEPMIRRPFLPLQQAIRSFFEEISPTFDSIEMVSGERTRADEAINVIRKSARVVVEEIAREGGRARVAAKKVAWGSLDENAAAALEALALHARESALSSDEMKERISAMSEAA